MEPKEPSVFRQLVGSAVSGFAEGLAIIVGSGLVGAIIGGTVGFLALGPVGAIIGLFVGAIVVGAGAIFVAAWFFD